MVIDGVAPETKIILKSMQEVEIVNHCGTIVPVWSGYTWSNVLIRETGQNQKVMEVHFSDGNSVSCTIGHTWYIKHGYNSKAITTAELKIGNVLDAYSRTTDRKIIIDTVVTDIYYDDRICTTYCFNEIKRGRAVYNNVMAGAGQIP